MLPPRWPVTGETTETGLLHRRGLDPGGPLDSPPSPICGGSAIRSRAIENCLKFNLPPTAHNTIGARGLSGAKHSMLGNGGQHRKERGRDQCFSISGIL